MLYAYIILGSIYSSLFAHYAPKFTKNGRMTWRFWLWSWLFWPVSFFAVFFVASYAFFYGVRNVINEQ